MTSWRAAPALAIVLPLGAVTASAAAQARDPASFDGVAKRPTAAPEVPPRAPRTPPRPPRPRATRVPRASRRRAAGRGWGVALGATF